MEPLGEPSGVMGRPAPDSLRRRFFRLSLLNILSNLAVPLASLVDTGMLGHLEDIRFLAGVALAGILFEYVYWSFGFLRMGTTGLTAQAVGRGETREVYAVLYRSLALALGIGLAILGLQSVLRELGFLLLSGAGQVEAAGREYFDARIWGAPATLANFAFLGWFLGREESGRALVVALFGTLVNVALNYVFILLLGWAAWGAGLATALAQYVMLAVAVTLFLRSGRVEPWHWRQILERGQMGNLLRLNRDILVRTFCLISAFALFTNFSSILGTVLLAANTILMRILTLGAYLVDGAAYATESLGGIFYGGGDGASVRRLVRMAQITGQVFVLVVLALLYASTWLTSGGAYGLLTSHQAVIELATSYGPWLLVVLPLGCVAYIYDGLFLGLTQGRALRNAMLLSLGVFLPGAWLALELESNHLLWLSFGVFMAARVATLHWARKKLGPWRQRVR